MAYNPCKHLRLRIFETLVCLSVLASVPSLPAQGPAAGTAKAVGTVKAAAGRRITLAEETGSEINVVVQDGARVLRVEPGEKDLKNAAPLELEDLQPGDRILVRGTNSPDGKSLLAVSVIAMKKVDLAEKRAHQRQEWQKHGIGGLVSAVDPAAGVVTISASALGATKSVSVHVSGNTILRRYPPGSVKFDDAAPAPLDQIKVGDQLRARGARAADGSELTADEVVSGSFRNIAGTIVSIDTGGSTISVADLASKKQVAVKVNDASQLRKLPPAMAQRIAARMKGAPADAPGGGAIGATAAGGARQGLPGAGQAPGQGGAPDLQQAIARVPAATLAELQKGDAVMIVGTPGAEGSSVVAITLLAGVEPILQASPGGGQSILTPWSLSSSPGGDAAAQ